MSYTALYRKYRPADFGSVIGQEHIVRTLKNQIITGRVSHAYLFCGTRGTGKTSVAKIFAKAINCMNNENGEPCGECEVCRNIAAGRSINVIEIDAASNNGVDNVREIREEVMYPPTEGRYKVYIIDEVHMLSAGAFNALLKTLEEPPAHVIFILATTDPQKVPVTILSRCQRFDFKRIPSADAVECIKKYLKEENIEADDNALKYICSLADGSMRDALSLLDQCISFYFGEKITLDKVLKVSGNVDKSVYFDITDAIVSKNPKKVLDIIASVVEDGRDIAQFTVGLISHFRNLLVVISSKGETGILDMSEENLNKYKAAAEKLSVSELIYFIKELSAFSAELKYAPNKRVMLEVELIKLTEGAYDGGIEAVMAKISGLERKLKNAGTAVVVKEASAVKKPAAAPKLKPADAEDIKKAVSVWKDIIKEMEPVTAGILSAVTASGGEEDELMLVCHDEAVMKLVKNRIDTIEAAYAKKLGSSLNIKLITKEDYEAKFDTGVSDEDREFESLTNMYFEEADFE